MSEVIAGLVGGLLALSGAFLVHWRTEVIAKRRELRAAATEYLVSAAAMSNEIGLDRLEIKGRGSMHERTQALAARVEMLSRCRITLTLLTRDRIAARVDDHADSLVTLLHEAHATSLDVVEKRRKEIRTEGQVIEQLLRAGRR